MVSDILKHDDSGGDTTLSVSTEKERFRLNTKRQTHLVSIY